MSREYGRGSIVSFIVVGLLLGAVVLGGLFVVRNQMASLFGAAQDVQEEGEEVAVDTTTNKESAAPSEDKNTVNDNDAAVDDAADAPARDRTDTGRDDTGSTSNTPAVREEAEESSDDKNAMPTAGVELPQTGLADSIFAAVPLVALVAAVVAYRRSNML